MVRSDPWERVELHHRRIDYCSSQRSRKTRLQRLAEPSLAQTTSEAFEALPELKVELKVEELLEPQQVVAWLDVRIEKPKPPILLEQAEETE